MGNRIEEQTITENANGILQRWRAVLPNGPGVYEGLRRDELLSLYDHSKNGAANEIYVELHKSRDTALITERLEDRTYLLDASGRVVRFEGPMTRFGDNPQYIAEYEYDAAGRLVRELEQVRHPLLGVVVTYIGELLHSYPDGGIPITETVTHFETVFLEMKGKSNGS